MAEFISWSADTFSSIIKTILALGYGDGFYYGYLLLAVIILEIVILRLMEFR